MKFERPIQPDALAELDAYRARLVEYCTQLEAELGSARSEVAAITRLQHAFANPPQARVREGRFLTEDVLDALVALGPSRAEQVAAYLSGHRRPTSAAEVGRSFNALKQSGRATNVSRGVLGRDQ